MKVLIVSDTHGNSEPIEKIVSLHSDFSIIIHAGDYARDLDFLDTQIQKYTVKGNCDNPAHYAPERQLIDLGKSKIFLTHGHLQHAKLYFDQLIEESIKNSAEICVFGHTHKPIIENRDGILLINPGSIIKSRSRINMASYVLMTVDKTGDVIDAKIMTL